MLLENDHQVPMHLEKWESGNLLTIHSHDNLVELGGFFRIQMHQGYMKRYHYFINYMTQKKGI